LAALNIGSAATVRLVPTVLTDPQVLVTKALTISGLGVLDIRDKAAVIDYLPGPSPLPAVQTSLTSGYAGGAWNGSGINSAVAAATPQHALGYAEATDLFTVFPASFAGQSIDNTAVLIRYTRYGDANLDQTVNLADFNRLASSFGQTNTRWSQGNSNFDLFTNLSDFNLLASNFGLSASPGVAAAVLGNGASSPFSAVLIALERDGE
jgi:hypothetical protein